MDSWPIPFASILSAKARIDEHLPPTAARNHPILDAAVGHGIEVWVKHEHHQPTGSFKIRNGINALSCLSPDQRERGVIAASRGNHGQGVAYAGRLLGIPVTICVPEGNSPMKNKAMRALGAEVVEKGADYDASVQVAVALAQERGLHMAHSTNDPTVVAGAATLSLEFFEQVPQLDALVVAVGGGSQAVGAISVARELRPELPIYGVQAERACAIHDGYHAGKMVDRDSADTFADGLATRHCYELTFEPLRQGLEDFILVSEENIANAIRCYLESASSLAEGAGAAGLAGLIKLAPRLANKKVGVILSGGNIDPELLVRILEQTRERSLPVSS